MNEHLKQLWKVYQAGNMSQPDYELGYLSWMAMTQHEHYPETDENFLPLFESIIIKLADMQILSESEWESIQRLYFIRDVTILIEDLQEVFGYKFVEVTK